MFYVTYVTVDGHSSTVHADFKAAQTIFNQFAQAEGYPYVQWGGLGSGLIDESFRPHAATFGTPESEIGEVLKDDPAGAFEQSVNDIISHEEFHDISVAAEKHYSVEAAKGRGLWNK